MFLAMFAKQFLSDRSVYAPSKRGEIPAGLLVFITMICWILSMYSPAYGLGTCPDTPSCSDESVDYFITDHSAGTSITDGATLPLNTVLDLNARATASGECETTIINCPACPPCGDCFCDVGPTYQRTVNNVKYYLDAATDGPLNGNYYLGATFCWDPATHFTAFYQVLDSRNEGLCPSHATQLLPSPGSYTFSFINVINNYACLLGSCPDSVTKTTTIYAGGETVNNTCNIMAGDGVSAANGVVIINETDVSMDSVVPTMSTRYYNSSTASNTTRSLGTWGYAFDATVAALGPNFFKLTNPDGSVVYYSDINGDTVYEAVIPKGETSRLARKMDNSYERTLKDGGVETFNPFGYMTAAADRNGNTVTFVRDGSNRLTTILDPFGRTTSLSYDASNRINLITTPDGKTTSYSYLSSGALQKVTYPDGTYKTYEYLLNYLLTGIKNEKGNYIKKYTYTYNNGYRVLSSSTDGTNNKVTFTYVDSTHTTVTDSLGRATTYSFDKSGGKNRALTISGPGCAQCTRETGVYTYDSDLNVTSFTDAAGYVTAYTYDSKGNMLTRTEAQGTASQRTTTFTYEPVFNQVTSVTEPGGGTTVFGYDAKGNLASTTDPNGSTTYLTRDTRGRVTVVTDPSQGTYNLAYDQYGNLATVTNAMGSITTYAYDIMGNLMSVVDSNGNSTAYSYDQRRRLTHITDAINGVTAFAYDSTGNLTAVADPKGNSIQFLYDNINRLVRETNYLLA